MSHHCSFCQKRTEPSFKDAETLGKYLTIRGKIMPRERTGICAWHQRKLASEIKLARTIALLPYVVYEA